MSTSNRNGVVTRISPLKMVYVADRASGESYVFRYSQIRGYQGESPRELGLKPGRAVRFGVASDNRVTEVALV